MDEKKQSLGEKLKSGLNPFYLSMEGLALFAFLGNFACNYILGYCGHKDEEEKIRNSRVCELRLPKNELSTDWMTRYLENEGKEFNPRLLMRELYGLNNKFLSPFDSGFKKDLNFSEKENSFFDFTGDGKIDFGGLEVKFRNIDGMNHTQFSYGPQF